MKYGGRIGIESDRSEVHGENRDDGLIFLIHAVPSMLFNDEFHGVSWGFNGD